MWDAELLIVETREIQSQMIRYALRSLKKLRVKFDSYTESKNESHTGSILDGERTQNEGVRLKF